MLDSKEGINQVEGSFAYVGNCIDFFSVGCGECCSRMGVLCHRAFWKQQYGRYIERGMFRREKG